MPQPDRQRNNDLKMTKTIVVLGGAFAGIQVAHRLLKHTRPAVADLKVILVSKVSMPFCKFPGFSSPYEALALRCAT